MPFPGVPEPGDGPQNRTLSGAAGPGDEQSLSRRNLRRRIPEERLPVIGGLEGDMLQSQSRIFPGLDDRGRGGRYCRRPIQGRGKGLQTGNPGGKVTELLKLGDDNGERPQYLHKGALRLGHDAEFDLAGKVTAGPSPRWEGRG